MTTPARFALACLFAALAATAVFPVTGPGTWPSPAHAEDGGERRDNTMGTPGHPRPGVDERGDNEIRVEPRPGRKQQVPDIGPIYVVPQVNAGPGRAPVILPPVDPGTPRP